MSHSAAKIWQDAISIRISELPGDGARLPSFLRIVRIRPL